eukprot:CAMPEP_0179423174 /NCGR_PEP_ID=MMETSP0799-20121207/10854_1 /TAXON_ID=46947 /ORGANISM="Geminigera cryophila, Strain CCMP2564" /LENGTH=153 /DNA_ID=CAMNT_0021197421 /DNA_START=295 /DNA_END=756 /DNA_ORIENTATION=+
MSVKVINSAFKPEKRLLERQAHCHSQIFCLPPKCWMGKLAQFEFKVAGRSIWRFVGLILEHHFVAIGRAALYVYLHRFRATLDFTSVALIAFVSHFFAFPATFGACSLHLLHEAGRDLLPHHFHSAATTAVAAANIVGTPCARPPALSAQQLL